MNEMILEPQDLMYGGGSGGDLTIPVGSSVQQHFEAKFKEINQANELEHNKLLAVIEELAQRVENQDKKIEKLEKEKGTIQKQLGTLLNAAAKRKM